MGKQEMKVLLLFKIVQQEKRGNFLTIKYSVKGMKKRRRNPCNKKIRMNLKKLYQ